MTDSPLARLVDRVEPRLPELVDRVFATILEQITLYRGAETVPADELRRSVEHNLRYMISAMRDPLAPRDFSAPEETGRRRAQQGAPLPEVLRAFRIGFTSMWDLLAEQARADAEPDTIDTLLAAAARTWQLTDEYAEALTEAYRTSTAELLVAQQQRRSALAEALFTGEQRPDAGPWEVSQLLGLPADGDFVVIVAETSTTAEAGLAGIERGLADRGIASAWRLAPGRQMGVVSLRPGQSGPALEVTTARATTRTGISPVYRSLYETPRAVHLASVALGGLPAGRAEVAVFTGNPLAGLLARQRDESDRLVREVLGPVLELPVDDRTTLIDTLQAWFDHAGSAERAAEAMFCHSNTVRYRLRRIHELSGRSPAEPWAVADLAAALQALRLRREG
ncbi:transcriptional regulator [Amycolatopsis antarctica]|uniref:Transcriptional regulator n=1 Tax=Amycolatopsis antarctica TaxID=1854586 RepID=A0A263D021_9PSEU|nr:helix-turn-helix domain-containing protein [Amycolatopsis antarctica]OZM71784.1 transcriptional regulator [Amycolatopsis antarctica]